MNQIPNNNNINHNEMSGGPAAAGISLEPFFNPLDVGQLEKELNRVNYNTRFHALLRSTVYALIVTAAVAVLVAVLLMPVLRIYGNSMTPTLTECTFSSTTLSLR